MKKPHRNRDCSGILHATRLNAAQVATVGETDGTGEQRLALRQADIAESPAIAQMLILKS